MRAAYEHIAHLLLEALRAPGDAIELGVWRGDTFVGMASVCQELGRTCYAVDSWKGMAAPTERDYLPDGRCQYPLGSLAADLNEFRERVAPFGDAVRVWPGWIPEVLYELPQDLRICFAHIDLDQYAPQIAALEWTWPRVSPGGIVVAHDYFPNRTCLASAAVDEWMRIHDVELAGILPSRHAWFRKPNDPSTASTASTVSQPEPTP